MLNEWVVTIHLLFWFCLEPLLRWVYQIEIYVQFHFIYQRFMVDKNEIGYGRHREKRVRFVVAGGWTDVRRMPATTDASMPRTQKNCTHFEREYCLDKEMSKKPPMNDVRRATCEFHVVKFKRFWRRHRKTVFAQIWNGIAHQIQHKLTQNQILCVNDMPPNSDVI